jgi:hypothetical protein
MRTAHKLAFVWLFMAIDRAIWVGDLFPTVKLSWTSVVSAAVCSLAAFAYAALTPVKREARVPGTDGS